MSIFFRRSHRGREIVEVCVEAVLSRGEVDRSVLAVDFNEALGLITPARPNDQRGDLLAKRQGLNSLKDTAEMECSSDWVSVPEQVAGKSEDAGASNMVR